MVCASALSIEHTGKPILTYGWADGILFDNVHVRHPNSGGDEFQPLLSRFVLPDDAAPHSKLGDGDCVSLDRGNRRLHRRTLI